MSYVACEPGGSVSWLSWHGMLGRTRCTVKHINVLLRLPQRVVVVQQSRGSYALLVRGDQETVHT